jgi:hypothetical protein
MVDTLWLAIFGFPPRQLPSAKMDLTPARSPARMVRPAKRGRKPKRQEKQVWWRPEPGDAESMCGIPAKQSRDRLDNGLLIDVPRILCALDHQSPSLGFLHSAF